MRKKICMLLIISCLCFIWVNSFFSAEISGGLSKAAEKFLKVIFGDGFPISESGLRKLAHAAEYAAFGFLSAVFMYEKLEKELLSIGFCGLGTAVFDETIQLFSVGRSSQVKDILIDFSGFSVGIIVVLIIKFLLSCLKGKKDRS